MITEMFARIHSIIANGRGRFFFVALIASCVAIAVPHLHQQDP